MSDGLGTQQNQVQWSESVSQTKREFEQGHLLVQKLWVHLARLAQWLVKKAPQELDVPLEKLEGELDLTMTHVLLAFVLQEMSFLIFLTLMVMKFLHFYLH